MSKGCGEIIKSIVFYVFFGMCFVSFSEASDITFTTELPMAIGIQNTKGGSLGNASITCTGDFRGTPAGSLFVKAYVSGTTSCDVFSGTGDYTSVGMTNNAAAISVGTKAFPYSDSILPSGQYSVVVITCKSATCGFSNKVQVFTSSIFLLNGSQSLSQVSLPRVAVSQTTNYTSGTNKTVTYSFCVGIRSLTTGIVYGTGRPYSCTDAIDLPPAVVPVNCTVNSSMDVPMGSISREGIGTVAGGLGVVRRVVPVNCDGNTNATLELAYSPLGGTGDAAASTSLSNLGVSIRYNSVVFGNGDTKNVTLNSGVNNLDFDFTPIVRAGATSATGNYSSSASLVMTWP